MRAETPSAFERHLIAASMRPKTISTYLRIVGLFESAIAPRTVADAASADIEAFLARVRRTGAPAATATRNLELIALRRLFRSLGTVDPTSGFQLKRPERRDPAVPTSEQLRSIFETAAIDVRPARALAIVGLLFQAGLRVHELALDVEQVDLASGMLVGAFGKGGVRRARVGCAPRSREPDRSRDPALGPSRRAKSLGKPTAERRPRRR